MKQIVSPNVGLAFIFVFGFILISGLQTTDAFEWWKPFKYEKWNCCPGFNPNSNFKPVLNSESNSTNGIIQNVEINQVCDSVEICLVDLHDLNNQISYINTEYSIK